MIRALFAGLLAIVLTSPALAAVEIKEVTSPGGIRAWLVEEHGIPFTALEIRFQGGASLDAPAKRGFHGCLDSHDVQRGRAEFEAIAVEWN